jgi:hypothetical protein
VSSAYASGAGSTLRLLGSSTVGAVTQTFASGFTNNGTIELTTTGSAQSVQLAVASGTLVNPFGRSIQALAGSGGFRTLAVQLDNAGTLTVGGPFTLGRSGAAHLNSGTVDVSGADLTVSFSTSFTNSGAITLGSGGTFTMNGGTFTHSAGSISGAGTLEFANSSTGNVTAAFSAGGLSGSSATVNLTPSIATSTTALSGNGATFNGPGTITNSAGITTTLRACTIGATLVNDGTLVLEGTGAVSGSYTSGAGSTLRILGSNVVGAASQTFSSGFTNHGTIELTAIGGSQSVQLTVASGTLVNAAGDSINALAGSGGFRTLAAQLDNRGTVTSGVAFTLGRASADHLNSGRMNVSGGDLTVTQNGTTPTFSNTGTIDVSAGRTCTIEGGTFTHGAGSISGAGTLMISNGTGDLVAPFGLGALSGSSATINLTPSLATATTALAGNNSTFNGPGTITNSGGIATTLRGCTMNAALVNNGTLTLTATGAINGTFTTGPGSLIQLAGSPVAGQAIQTFANGFTNNGTIEMSGNPQSANLNVTNGTLVNAAGRTISVLAGPNGSRFMSAHLNNQGTLSVGATLSMFRSNLTIVNGGAIDVTGGNLVVSGVAPASLTNNGTITLGGGRTLQVSSADVLNSPTGVVRGNGILDVSAGGVTFTNQGTLAPGFSPGQLQVTGACTMTTTAHLPIEIGGTAPGTTYDRLVVTGPVELHGALDISLANGFVPSPGQSFAVLHAGSRSVAFAPITGLSLPSGLTLEPVYSDTGLVLRVVAEAWKLELPLDTPPLAREGHSAVYDDGSGRMIVFGGRTDAGAANDLWVFEQAASPGESPHWIALTPSGTPPAPRLAHVAAYDAATNQMIVLGGDDGAGTPAVYGDVWRLSHANGLGGTPAWTPLAIAGGPGPLTGAAAGYDAASDRLMLFGGSATGACGVASNDAWILANAFGGGTPTWSALTPSGTPPGARAYARAAYDATDNVLIVYSGLAPCGSENSEVWTLSNANGIGGPAAWTQLSPTGAAPAASAWQAVAYDAVGDRLLSFGGIAGSTPSSELYSLSPAGGISATPDWRHRSHLGPPPAPRSDAAGVEVGGRMMMFGGRLASGLTDEVWTLLIDEVAVADAPPPGLPGTIAATGFARPPAPNPSRDDVRFDLVIARDEPVDLIVRDLAGRRVRTLHEGAMSAGAHTLHWDGRTASGKPAPAGMYFVSLRAPDVRDTRRVLRIQ